ncbi:MAG TPA: hypothetical protein VLG92_00775 [Candidatus Saccharimonadia bacterium]|nr:hypothetical protein [Candidatus Saccharimonadia bacterium]
MSKMRQAHPVNTSHYTNAVPGIAQELVHRMKYERAQAGIYEIAALLTPLLADLPRQVVLTPVPTATRRVRAVVMIMLVY